MVEKGAFMQVVLDVDGSLRRRFNALHQRTRIQKCRLATEAFATGLEKLEKRLEAFGGDTKSASPAPAEKKEAAE